MNISPSCVAALAVLCCGAFSPAQEDSLSARTDKQESRPDASALEEIFGRKGLLLPEEDALQFYEWRRAIPVAWQGSPVDIFEGRWNQTTFARRNDKSIVHGCWLVFLDEALPTALALLDGGIRISALVPRFPGASPQPFELRFFGQGEEVALARSVQAARLKVMEKRDETTGAPPSGLPFASAPLSDAPMDQLEQFFGQKAEIKDGVVLFRFRGKQGIAGGTPGRRMGSSVFAAFGGAAPMHRVRVDWTVPAEDLAPVLRELGNAGYQVESLVAGAVGIEGDLYQVCCVAAGPASELAASLQRAMKLGGIGTVDLVAKESTPLGKGDALLDLGQTALANGWKSDATHPAGEKRAKWQVVQEGGTAIASMTDAGDWDGRTFNLLCSESVQFKNGSLKLRMRADAGRVDQGGGPIWRVVDERNYYVARFNPLEQDFRVYRVVDGVREQLQGVGDLPYLSNKWFTIEIKHNGDHITCGLNGVQYLDIRDATFAESGGVGVWSKADSLPSVSGLVVRAETSR